MSVVVGKVYTRAMGKYFKIKFKHLQAYLLNVNPIMCLKLRLKLTYRSNNN